MSIFGDIKLKGVDEKGQEKDFALADYDDTVVLYFYPKDNTSGCTKEASDFRDNFSKLVGKATVMGVSSDSVESHKQFQREHSLNFILLSDPEHKLAQMFGICKDSTEDCKNGIERSTFIIKNGLVTNAWKNVKVDGHVQKVLDSL